MYCVNIRDFFKKMPKKKKGVGSVFFFSVGITFNLSHETTEITNESNV